MLLLPTANFLNKTCPHICYLMTFKDVALVSLRRRNCLIHHIVLTQCVKLKIAYSILFGPHRRIVHAKFNACTWFKIWNDGRTGTYRTTHTRTHKHIISLAYFFPFNVCTWFKIWNDGRTGTYRTTHTHTHTHTHKHIISLTYFFLLMYAPDSKFEMTDARERIEPHIHTQTRNFIISLFYIYIYIFYYIIYYIYILYIYIFYYSYIYIYDIRSLRVNNLTLILLTWRKWWANNASK